LPEGPATVLEVAPVHPAAGLNLDYGAEIFSTKKY